MKFKKLLIFLIMLIIPFNVFAKESNDVKNEEFKDYVYDIVKEDEATKVTVYLFHSKSCPHCQAEIKYLQNLQKTYDFDLRLYEVSEDETNASYCDLVKERFMKPSNSIPFTVIGDKTFVGFSETSNGEEMLNAIKSYLGEEVDENTRTIPLLGNVNLTNVSIPLVAVILGLVDGFNPCAMWVLLFLISMLFNMKDKKKMWLLGFTFLFTSALVYFLAMLGISFALDLVATIWVRRIIAIVAIIGGGINIKAFFDTPKDGCNVVDDKKRKKYFEKIKKFTTEQNLFLALIGVISLAASVNLVELACSAGWPSIFTSILSLNNVSIVLRIVYMLIYILFYLLDDLVVFVVAMSTLKLTGITTKYNRLSHIIGGILMIIIGLLLIFKPEWIMFNF